MKNITILIVSYFSSKHLKRLITNLIEKSDQPNALQFLIVDNTNGRDKALKEILRNNRNIESLMNQFPMLVDLILASPILSRIIH